MKRTLLIAPLLFAAALSAQVPAVAPLPPLNPLPPVPAIAPLPPLPAPAPAFMTYPRMDNVNLEYNVDWAQSYAVDRAMNLSFDQNTLVNRLNSVNLSGNWGGGGPVAWSQDDPADSLYRMARDQFNRGDYRKAATLFKSLPQKFTNSVYIADAQYYQAFSLYRIGGTADLQEALAVLDARKSSPQDDARGKTMRQAPEPAAVGFSRQTVFYPGARGQTDAAGLAARIANVLSSRGMANDPAVKRALAAGGNTCDSDDQSVKAEALSALMQNDPETGRQMATKILANRDECSIPLRRNAVMLVGNRHDDAAAVALSQVAKSDPSPAVRINAIEYLVRMPGEAAVTTVIDLARSSDDPQVQRSALAALAQSTNPRARAEMRSILESSATSETLRANAIERFDSQHMTAEDVAWLRGLYAKTASAQIKERIVAIVARAGGDVNNQWVLALVRNDDEPLESRTTALSRVGHTMDLPTLSKMYDASSARPIRETVINLLAERKEPEAVDKLIDIAKNGTDVRMRSQAISVLARSKDPRASRMLLQLVDKQ